MKKLAQFVRSRINVFVIVAMAASILSGLCRAGLIGSINRALTGREVWLGVFLALCTAAPIFSIIAELLTVRTINETMFQLLLSIVRQLLRSPLRRTEEIGPHRILTVLTQDVAVVTTSLQLIPSIILQCAVILGCMAYLAYLSPMVFVTVLGFMIAGGLTFRFAHRWGHRQLAASRRRAEELFGHLDILTRALKEFKLNMHRQRQFVDRDLTGTAIAYKKHSLIGNAVYSISGNWSQFLFFLVMGFLLFAAPKWWNASHLLVSAYGLTLLFLLGPFTSLAGAAGNMGGIITSFGRLEALAGSLVASEPESGGDLKQFLAWEEIKISGIEYSYSSPGGDKPFTVGPLDLVIKPGDLTFIIGGNGSGKTTLGKLICGLYQPDSGHIEVDGRVLAQDSLQAYRQLFSAIFSDFYLFDNVLNVGFTDFDDRLNDYLKKFELDMKLTVRDGVFSTTSLSHGQRKRLALLAACMEDRPVYVFDEWAADQDPDFKRLFYWNILPSLKRQGKTIIVITHDDAYFDVADRVIKLDYGKVVSQTAYEAVAAP
jgi:putative ATP-binding cassette transporter